MSDKPDDGGAAFPGVGENFITGPNGDTGPQSMWGMHGDKGMSLRDYFAAQALPAVIQVCMPFECKDDENMQQMFARRSYEAADAMLKARGK